MRLMTARDQRPSLRFVEGINVELTYGCQLDCPHCLQADQRARVRRPGLTLNLSDAH